MIKTAALVLLILTSLSVSLYAQKPLDLNSYDGSFIQKQVLLDYNRIAAFIQNCGTFNQDLRNANTPGFNWPKGSYTHAIFTGGLSTAAYLNGQLRMAAASYTGEYRSGTINYLNGRLIPYSDERFKLYKVSKWDNCNTNQDWANWGLMVPYGAPYEDINLNGQYDPCIDIPGIIGAGQTVFICMTDAFRSSHTSGEGFGGGTLPLNAELRLTAWSYDSKFVGTDDAQFIRFQVINKSSTKWDSTRFSIFCDPDLGNATDDWVGCDSIRQIGYCYNSDNDDGEGGFGTYGMNPPAVGIKFLSSVKNKRSADKEHYRMNGFCLIRSTGSSFIICERDPNDPNEAFNFMNATKNDGTSWINPITMKPSKFVFSGKPEMKTGWTEAYGTLDNCNNDTTGNIVMSPGGDRRMVLSVGRENLTINPSDTMEIIISQMMARGQNNLNSVTQLLDYSDRVTRIFEHIYSDPLNVNPLNNDIPTDYFLSNNYPNPFNPITKIDYSIPKDFDVEISVYDILGNEVAVIHNGMQKAGNYSVEFNGSNFASGLYFLKMKSGSFIQTRKMVLIK